jgi:protoporphyrinogen/coproporphyrinogen III oxidase
MMANLNKVDVVVIGAGAAGLSCALRLADAGKSVLLLDRSDRPGGVIQTVRRQGFILERGPFNVLVRSEAFAWVLDKIDARVPAIVASQQSAKRRYVLTSNGLQAIPSSPWGLLSTSILSPLGRLRALGGLVASKRGKSDDTLDVVFRRRLGSEVAEKIGSAATVGIWASESDELEAAACMPRVVKIDKRFRSPLVGMFSLPKSSVKAPNGMVSFQGGLASLADEVARQLEDRIFLAMNVTTVRKLDQGWQVETENGSMYQSSHLVLACGARTAAKLLSPVVSEISQELSAIRHTSLTTVNLGFRREDVAHPLNGYGFLVPKKYKESGLLGVLFASTVFPHHAPEGHVLLRVFLGGTRHPLVRESNDIDVLQTTIASIQGQLGLRAAPVLTDISRWHDAIPVYGPGHVSRTRHIHKLANEQQGLWLAGNFLGGLSVNDCVTQGVQIADKIVNFSGDAPCHP